MHATDDLLRELEAADAELHAEAFDPPQLKRQSHAQQPRATRLL